MLEQFWQYGILAAVLVFGVKIGLCLGFSGMSRRNVGLILLGYLVALIGCSYILEPYTAEVYEIVYNYTSGIFAVIAIIIFITGVKTVYDWKVTGKDVGTSTCLAVVAPCPCCFGAILSSVIIVAPLSSVSSIELGALSGVSLVIVMAISYLLSGKIVKWANRPYPVVLGNFMLFLGLYFCLCLLILPNIELIMSGAAITISSTENFIEMGISAVILLVAGFIYARRRSKLLN